MALLKIVVRMWALRDVKASCVVCAFALLGGVDLSAQSAPPKEYQIKAVFLFNFAQFVEWPSAAFAGPLSPLIIGVLGENPFSGYLDETVRGETVNHRPLEVHYYRHVDDVKGCHILFISRSEIDKYELVFASLQGKLLLTVGDTPGFATRGGVIQFLTEQNRIRLRVNAGAAKSARLTISSRLLRAADIVGTERDR